MNVTVLTFLKYFILFYGNILIRNVIAAGLQLYPRQDNGQLRVSDSLSIMAILINTYIEKRFLFFIIKFSDSV